MSDSIRPVRLQLSRKKGFNLQKISLAYNGRDAVKVARPGPWGNPFVVTDRIAAGKSVGNGYIAVPTVEDAVECFREMMLLPESRERLERAHQDLRGKNLACWCRHDASCHADVLLALVNADDQDVTQDATLKAASK